VRKGWEPLAAELDTAAKKGDIARVKELHQLQTSGIVIIIFRKSLEIITNAIKKNILFVPRSISLKVKGKAFELLVAFLVNNDFAVAS